MFFLSYFYFFNFYNLSLDCFCNFSTKLSFAFVLEIKNNKNLVCKENKNKIKLLCSFYWFQEYLVLCSDISF
jgi:hypothetical protein